MKKRNDPYKTLGVDKSASPEQIKKARKRKAAVAHPDRGGDHETMAEVNHAFDVLIDPERRRLYDATGETERSSNKEEQVAQVVLQAFHHALEADAAQVLRTARDYVSRLVAQAQVGQKELQGKREKLEKRSGRVTVNNGDNLYQMILDQQLSAIDRALAGVERQLQIFTAALEMLKQYTSHEPALTIREQVMVYGVYRDSAFFT